MIGRKHYLLGYYFKVFLSSTRHILVTSRVGRMDYVTAFTLCLDIANQNARLYTKAVDVRDSDGKLHYFVVVQF